MMGRHRKVHASAALLHFGHRERPRGPRSRDAREDGTHPGFARSILGLTILESYSYLMRYSPEHKAQNHEKILSVAARSAASAAGTPAASGR